MGISLNGLTPAGTYPGLIKTGDNTAISGTPKVLSDGNGNDLPMEVSTTGVNFTNNLTQGGTALQPVLVSGTNIKTINGASLLGSGNIPVVTSPSGVSGAIQFSNGSAFASDATNLFWDDTNNRLGVGTNTPTATTHIRGVDQLNTSTSLLVTDSIGGQILRVHNDGLNSAVIISSAKIANYEIISGNVLSNPSMRFVPTSTGLAINKDYSNPAASTLVHIKGSGSTSATTSLLVQNSAGTAALSVRDDLNTTLGGNLTISSFNGILSGSNTIIFQTFRTIFNATFNTLAGQYAFLFDDGGGSNGQTSGTTGRFNLISRFAPTSGTAVYNTALINPTVNQTGGANGITRGLYINPTLTAAADFRAIEVSNGGAYINTTSVQASAILQADSTTKGFLPPRMTTTQKNAITAVAGLVLYDSTTNKLQCYNGSTWNDLF
jgi:hypothetical protein